MPTNIPQLIREAIIARLATINGEAGGFTISLTGPSQVQGGKFARPPGKAPFACVWLQQIAEDIGPPMDRMEQQGTWGILVWVTGSPKHPEDRQNKAEGALNDVRAALREDITFGDLVLWSTTAATPYNATEAAQTPDAQSFGIAFIALSATWREEFNVPRS